MRTKAQLCKALDSGERSWGHKAAKRIAEVLKLRGVLYNGGDIDKLLASRMTFQMLRLYGVRRDLWDECLDIAKRWQPRIDLH